MKKIFSIILCFVLTTVFCGCSNIKNANNRDKLIQGISEKIIRFHVLANSDSSKDQALKQKVKDEIIKYILPKLKESKSIDETRNILKENDESIVKVALKTIKNEGFNYGVKSQLSKENFPLKRYGTVVLPQGEYEAYRIIIGEGNGQNWWCVMFPPLCFIDITKGEVAEEETEEQMKEHLSKEEYDTIKEESTDTAANESNSKSSNRSNDKPSNKPNNKPSKSKSSNKKVTESKNKQNTSKPSIKDKLLKMVNPEDDKQNTSKDSQHETQKDTSKLDNSNSLKEGKDEIKLEFKIVEVFKKLFQ